MYSLSGETHLDDQETNELLCLPKPRKSRRKYMYRCMNKMHALTFSETSLIYTVPELEINARKLAKCKLFDNLQVRKISTSKSWRFRTTQISQTFGKNLLVVSPVC